MKNDLIQILQRTAELPDETVAQAEKAWEAGEGHIGEILVKKKALTEAQLMEAYGALYGLPFWPEFAIEDIDTAFTQMVPVQFLKKFVILPLGRNQAKYHPPSSGPETVSGNPAEAIGDDDFVIAVNDPLVLQPLDDLTRILMLDDYRLVISTRAAILGAINMAYDLSGDSAEQLVQNMEEDGSSIISEIEDTADLLDDTSDAPIIRLVNHIISQSIKARASDIHIEPYQDSFKVRYRVDGILHDFLTPPKWIQSALISRIKVMAKMNIAEKRLPQDNRLDVKMGGQEIDIRVSTIPTVFGERVVLRLLNKTGSLIRLPELGLSPERLETLKKIVSSPNGVFLVTGPTGSGKTTTLYALLSTINHPGINIITVEDPVEYQIRGVNQIQVNPKIDLTFARGLRSIVRQDPDVILIGEIRDKETADIAVQSALTGHLVFSTLHTNDAPSAITRLVDIGVEPFLISSVVVAVAAQRLVRVLCGECKERYEPDSVALESIGLIAGQADGKSIYRAVGCPYCFNTGYKGRVGIFEIMMMDHHLKNLILQTYDSHQIKTEALQNGMVSLRLDGINKVFEGQTTIEEVLRVTHQT